jgi:hypothetical protein
MTREPNPSQIPNPNDQIPQSVGHRQEKANSSLGFGAWSLGFDWDLATWDLVISNSSRRACHAPGSAQKREFFISAFEDAELCFDAN